MVIVEKFVQWSLAGETKVLGENLPQPTLSTTNPTWLDPSLNPGRRGGKPATNSLSYGATQGLNKIMETLQLLYIILYFYGVGPPFAFNTAAIRMNSLQVLNNL
jgi:hypothetical protein